MREQLLCSKIKLEKKIEENERLTNELTEMKSKFERVEQENQRFQRQIEEKNFLEIELSNTMEKLRTTQKQNQFLQQTHRSSQDKHEKEIEQYKKLVENFERKINEMIEERTMISIRCEELFEENHKLEKSLNEKEEDYEDKLKIYRDKNIHLNNQLEEMEKKFNEMKKHLEMVIVEKDETLADMLVAVRVASEMRHGQSKRNELKFKMFLELFQMQKIV